MEWIVRLRSYRRWPAWARRLAVFAMGAAVAATFVASPAAACSCFSSDHGFLIADGARLPANTSGVPWTGSSPWQGSGQAALPVDRFRIERLHGPPPRSLDVALRWATEAPIPLGPDNNHELLLLISPTDGFQRGASYVITDTSAESSISFSIAMEPLTWPKATDVGASLKVIDRLTGEFETATYGGSCSLDLIADQRLVEVELPKPLAAWRDVLFFSTLIDGEEWRPLKTICDPIPVGRDREGVGRTRLFADCTPATPWPMEPGSVLSEGGHRVHMVAWFPGIEGSFGVHTDIELSCS